MPSAIRPATRKSKPSSCLRSLMKRIGGASGSMPTRSTPDCRTVASTPLRSAAGVVVDAGVLDEGEAAGVSRCMDIDGILPR